MLGQAWERYSAQEMVKVKDSELVLVLDCQLEQQSVSVLVHMLDKEMDNELDLSLIHI